MRNLTGKRGHFLGKILVTIGFCGLIVCFLWVILGVYNKVVTYQYNVIGTLHSDNTENFRARLLTPVKYRTWSISHTMPAFRSWRT